jgi:hypothetical protein
MAKYVSKSKYKPHSKAEYSPAGIAQAKELERQNKGKIGLEIDNVLAGGPKRGHGRGKASDAGPSKKRTAANIMDHAKT